MLCNMKLSLLILFSSLLVFEYRRLARDGCEHLHFNFINTQNSKMGFRAVLLLAVLESPFGLETKNC